MTLRSKIVAPAVGPSALRRERLAERLSEAPRRRVTTVVAGAGFGKSTLLAQWAEDHEVAWLALDADDAPLPRFAAGLVEALRLRIPDLPDDLGAAAGLARGPDASADSLARADAFAATLCEALQERVTRPLGLVLDDLQELPADGPALRVVEALCRQAPPSVYLLLASRAELRFSIDRLRGQGQVLELGGVELAFAADEVPAVLEAELDADARELAGSLHAATRGWPAAVRLACEAMRALPPEDRGAAVERLRRPGGALFGYLAREVLAQEPPAVRELVRLTARLERVQPDLCATLGIAGAAEALRSLARRGLFDEEPGLGADWFAPTALTRDVALAELALAEDERAGLHARAARWYAAHGEPALALRSLRVIGDDAAVAALLVEHGPALLRSGEVQAVVEAGDALHDSARDAALDRLLGEAHLLRGDWDEALRCLDRAAGSDAAIDPGLAWRIGLIHHLRGQLNAALAAYGRGRADALSGDTALLHAWHGSAHWLRGDADASRALAARAHEVALATGDDRALAAAHTALAMLAALDGDRAVNDTHYLRALDHAERAGDVLQVIRIRVNRGSRNLEEGHYDAAIAELDLAIRLADLGGFGTFRALALTNRGESHLRLGRLEEAIADLDAARSVYQRLGSDDVVYPLGILGDVYRERGDLALARAAYEEAARRAEAMGDVQALVPALGGLARVLAADDPDAARAAATRAVACGAGMGQVGALLAAGHVALAAGDHDAAAVAAAEAGAVARVRRERAGLAEALELEGRAADTERARRGALEQAVAVWCDLHNPLGAARAELALAHEVGGPLATLGAAAEARLRELGARPDLARLDGAPPAAMSIEALGGFRVLRDGAAVPRAEWRSRKARDLLKILVARHGRPVQRDALIEALWPGEDPARCANRLSVALSTLRGVLDPQRRYGADRFVASTGGAVALDLEHVDVDLEAFLRAAGTGLALRAEGRGAEAHEHLVAAESAYAGDLLEEDLYEDWAVAAREDARDTYIRVARCLAADAREAGDRDGAVRFLLRVLERDPFDEEAHLALVGAFAEAGRHGEARRAFRAYRARMDEIGVEPASFPAPAAA